MDIVTRLKTFMNSLDMTSSQFADLCRIPRPSLSQLLNGRNKKVSDEIVTKIHDAFPQLSIVWLMFGEGEMESNSNIQFSEAQNTGFSAVQSEQRNNNQHTIDILADQNNNITFSSENFEKQSADLFSDNPSVSTPSAGIGRQLSSATKSGSIKLNTSTNKRITNIVVFYDDNSFESFNPAT